MKGATHPLLSEQSKTQKSVVISFAIESAHYEHSCRMRTVNFVHDDFSIIVSSCTEKRRK